MILSIKDLHVQIGEKAILKGLNLEIEPGKVHVIMGPNGAGKSTLAKVLAGHPDPEVTSGDVGFLGKDLLELDPDERVHQGLFMSYQYPVEIAGITNFDMLFAAKTQKQKALGEKPISENSFQEELNKVMAELKVSEEFSKRDVNCGFSGGEKKRNEILQMAILDPKFAILDETDSGLDIDALKVVAEGVNLQRGEGKSLLLITHYQRLLDYIEPDVVHVMMDGQIVKTGDASLARELEKHGYDWIKKECGSLA